MIKELIASLRLEESKQSKGPTHLYTCPACSEAGHLSINFTTDEWQCFTCDTSGHPYRLVMHCKPDMRPAEVFDLLEANGFDTKDTGWEKSGPEQDPFPDVTVQKTAVSLQSIDFTKQHTVVADHSIRLAPAIQLYIDYHLDFTHDRAVITAFRLGEFIKWAFNDPATMKAFQKISPKCEIIKGQPPKGNTIDG